MEVGLRFIIKGEEYPDCYDPVEYPDNLKETDDEFIIEMLHTYVIKKSTVESWSTYPLCEICQHEIEEDGCRCQHHTEKPKEE